jgi:hypothetical protein
MSYSKIEMINEILKESVTPLLKKEGYKKQRLTSILKGVYTLKLLKVQDLKNNL